MASVQASSLSVGTSVYLKYNENYEEFLVIHQGNPNSSIYDSSCNGTWLLKRNCFGTSDSAFLYGSNYNYATSYIHSYLTNNFNNFGTEEQNIIKQIKIPYYDNTSLKTGSQGLSTRLFILSIDEIFGDISTEYPNNSVISGIQLSFFSKNINSFEIRDNNGNLYDGYSGAVWSRSPGLNSTTKSVCVYGYIESYGGLINTWLASDEAGCLYQPAMVISSDTLFDSSTMRLTIDDSSNNNTSSNTTYKVGDVLNYEYTGSMQSITLPAGTYQLKCWGAQGGSYSTSYAGGLGGYSVGTITLTEKSTNLYLYVGGQGTSTGTSVTGTVVGGFNGGGNGYSSSTTYLSSAGGGASDIRIGQDSLYARVIVAGGGGGSGSYNASYHCSGGIGGGSSGDTGGKYSTSYPAGTGGTATTAGTSYYGSTTNSTDYGTPASFGQGGAAATNSGTSGGGGGWYGGGYGRRSSGGGGSGYVYTSSTASSYPSGCLLNSSYYLTEASTTAGQRSGNGYITITVLELSTLPVSIKIDSSTWNENIEMYVKIDSTTWKLVDSIYIKTENGWKEGG